MPFPRVDAAAVAERGVLRESSAHDPRMLLAWLLASLLLALAVWTWWARGDDVRRLPAEHRRALYAHTVETLRMFCAPSDQRSPIDDYCSRQAALVLQFPECDAACRALAEPHRPRATR